MWSMLYYRGLPIDLNTLDFSLRTPLFTTLNPH